MTFCGDLPFVPSGIHHHLFENLRRMGHHCHGRKRLSGADRKSFCLLLGKSFADAFHPWTGGDGCGCLCPRRQGLKLVNGTGHNNGQDPPQRREARFAKRRCALHPGAFCRDAGSAGHGATEAARPERSLQARVFTHRTVATARNRASGFGGDWQVRQQLPVGVGPDDRMPPGSREPKVRPADRTTLQ